MLLKHAEKQLDNLGSFYTSYVLHYFKGRPPQTYIAAAIAAFFGPHIYYLVPVPSKLRHIPAAPFWEYMRSALSKDGIEVRARDLIIPELKKSPNGLYLRPHKFGWCVAVAGPSAAKTLLLRKVKDTFAKKNDVVTTLSNVDFLYIIR